MEIKMEEKGIFHLHQDLVKLLDSNIWFELLRIAIEMELKVKSKEGTFLKNGLSAWDYLGI